MIVINGGPARNGTNRRGDLRGVETRDGAAQHPVADPTPMASVGRERARQPHEPRERSAGTVGGVRRAAGRQLRAQLSSAGRARAPSHCDGRNDQRTGCAAWGAANAMTPYLVDRNRAIRATDIVAIVHARHQGVRSRIVLGDNSLHHARTRVQTLSRRAQAPVKSAIRVRAKRRKAQKRRTIDPASDPRPWPGVSRSYQRREGGGMSPRTGRGFSSAAGMPAGLHKGAIWRTRQ